MNRAVELCIVTKMAREVDVVEMDEVIGVGGLNPAHAVFNGFTFSFFHFLLSLIPLSGLTSILLFNPVG